MKNVLSEVVTLALILIPPPDVPNFRARARGPYRLSRLPRGGQRIVVRLTLAWASLIFVGTT